jgi:hypothetical protein
MYYTSADLYIEPHSVFFLTRTCDIILFIYVICVVINVVYECMCDMIHKVETVKLN